MVRYMLALGKRVRGMGKAFLRIKMDQHMMALGKTIREMEKHLPKRESW